MWHYGNGEWSQREYEWLESLTWGGSDGTDYVLQENMATEMQVGGSEGMTSFTLLAWNDGTRPDGAPEFLIAVDLRKSMDHLAAEALPDALDLMARWAPMVTAERLTHWKELQAEEQPPRDRW
jgi:hypothetical protein